MVNFFRRGVKTQAASTPETPEEEAQFLDEHPDVVHADPSLMDPLTRAMYFDAREAGRDAQVEKRAANLREFTFRQPFQLGFVLTFGALAAILVGSALGQLSSVIIYVVGALFVALGLDPIVRMLERRGVKRPIGIGVVFGGFILIVGGILATVIPTLSTQITTLIRTAPRYFSDISNQQWFIDLNTNVGDWVDLKGILSAGQDLVAKPGNWAQVAGGILEAGIGIANGLTATLIVLILSLYFLASLKNVKRGFYSLTPRSARGKVMDITEQVTKSVGGFVNGMVLLAFINAVLGFIAMTIFQVPFAPLVAVGVFFLALIPLIGSVLATILVTVVGLFASPATAIAIAVYYLIFMQIESYVLTPRVMSRVVSVPGSLVVIGAIAGGTLLGLLGALIAIPVTAMVLMIIKQVWIPRQELR
jgi:predicted PurR-regulated permease PerM